MGTGGASGRRRSEPEHSSPPSGTTREVLIELAAQVFATEGYASASVRDLSRRAGVTSGAIYGNFRDKAGLLAEAVDARLTTDLWTLPEEVTSRSLVDIVAYQFEHSERRRQLMSLLLEGAVAAPHDPELRARLSETLGRRIDASSKAFEARREAEGFDAAADLDAAVKIFYAIEIGLRALSDLGIESPDAQSSANLVRRFSGGLREQTQPSSASGRVSKAAKKAVPRGRSDAPKVTDEAATKSKSKASAKATGKSLSSKVKKPVKKSASRKRVA